MINIQKSHLGACVFVISVVALAWLLLSRTCRESRGRGEQTSSEDTNLVGKFYLNKDKLDVLIANASESGVDCFIALGDVEQIGEFVEGSDNALRLKLRPRLGNNYYQLVSASQKDNRNLTGREMFRVSTDVGHIENRDHLNCVYIEVEMFSAPILVKKVQAHKYTVKCISP